MEMPNNSNDGPTDLDVLCENSREAFNHNGNKLYRQFVTINVQKYKNAPSAEKMKVAQRILDAFRQVTGGRFLRRNKDGNWYDIGDDEALRKTHQAFRDATDIQNQSIHNSTKA